jgi:hypothetical protein
MKPLIAGPIANFDPRIGILPEKRPGIPWNSAIQRGAWKRPPVLEGPYVHHSVPGHS